MAPPFDSRVYTASEAIYLKGLGGGRHVAAPGPGEQCGCGRCEALYLSEGWKDSLAQGDGGSNAEETLPIIARWWDVRDAVEAVVKEKRDREIMQLRTQGYPEEDIARITGLSRSMVRRRFEARLADLLEQMGGEYVEPPRVSVPSKCLTLGCGGERAWLVASVAELWAYVGERRAPDGKLCQAWQCRKELLLRRRAIARTAAVGDVYELTWTVPPRGDRKLIAHREVPEAAFPAGHPWVKGWERDSTAAADDRPVPVREWRVPTEVRDAQRARRSSCCKDCIMASLRPRVEQSRRGGGE